MERATLNSTWVPSFASRCRSGDRELIVSSGRGRRRRPPAAIEGSRDNPPHEDRIPRRPRRRHRPRPPAAVAGAASSSFARAAPRASTSRHEVTTGSSRPSSTSSRSPSWPASPPMPVPWTWAAGCRRNWPAALSRRERRERRRHVEARPRRSARPARYPVCWPPSTTTWPLTIT